MDIHCGYVHGPRTQSHQAWRTRSSGPGEGLDGLAELSRHLSQDCPTQPPELHELPRAWGEGEGEDEDEDIRVVGAHQ